MHLHFAFIFNNTRIFHSPMLLFSITTKKKKIELQIRATVASLSSEDAAARFVAQHINAAFGRKMVDVDAPAAV